MKITSGLLLISAGSPLALSQPALAAPSLGVSLNSKSTSGYSSIILAVVGVIVLTAVIAVAISLEKKLAMQREVNKHFLPGMESPSSASPPKDQKITGSDGAIIVPNPTANNSNKPK